MEIWTANIIACRDPVIDITVKTGTKGVGACLAPTWELVGGHKHFRAKNEGWPLVAGDGKPQWFCQHVPLSNEQYTEKYLTLLRERWKADASPFIELLKCDKLVLGCYCDPDEFCHRKLAADVLIKLASAHKLDAIYNGEIPAKTSHPTLFDKESAPEKAIESKNAPESPKNVDFRAVAGSLVELMRPHCDRVEIAGSIRRGKPDPKDIEIVLIPKSTWHQFCDDLVEQGILQKRLVRTKIKDGTDMRPRWGKDARFATYQDVSVDLFCANADNWGYQFWLRTGPGDANQAIMSHLASNNTPVRFKDGYAWAAGRRLRLPEEDDLFAVLGLPIISPAARTSGVYQSQLRNAWPDFTPYFLPDKPLVQRTFITEEFYLKEPEGKTHHRAEKEIVHWWYQTPWLHESGQVWVHGGYGHWRLLPQDDERAKAQLEQLQRLGENFRNSRQHTLETWLIHQGHVVRKEIEVIESPTQPVVKNLNIIQSPSDISLTVQDFIGQRVALLGISGSGKTNTAATLIEELISYLPMSIIDIEGEYWTLKSKYKVLVVGRSPNCDIDVPTIHAEALAEYAYQNNVNVVLDFKYHDHEEEMFEFCQLYFERIWKLATRNQKPYEIVIEESHEFIPQSANTPISKLFKRIATRGRKHGLGVILASQRSTLVDKNVLTQAGIYFLHRVVHPKDMQVYKEFIPLKPAEVESFVGNLQPGECVFMRDHKPQPAKIRHRYTVHAGSTPTLGQGAEEQPALKQIDDTLLDDLRSMFNAPPKDDFAALRQRIADLELVNKYLNERNADLEAENAKLRKELTEYVGQDVPTILPEIEPEDGKKVVENVSDSDDVTSGSIMVIAAAKAVTTEQKAYERRVNTQKAAFEKFLANVKELPNWQRFALAFMEESNKAWNLEDLAAAIAVRHKTVTDAPLSYFREIGIVKRFGSRGNHTFKSELTTFLKTNYSELDPDELKKQLFKTVKELA